MSETAIEFFEDETIQNGLRVNGVENYYLDELELLSSINELVALEEYFKVNNLEYSPYIILEVVATKIEDKNSPLVINQFESVMYIHENDDIFADRVVQEIKLDFLRGFDLLTYYVTLDDYKMLYVVPKTYDIKPKIVKLFLNNKYQTSI